ncbi:hypothetical protein BGZ83_010710 [Gryganskiella cystojenkinii]|nr:hypothetical protein BGZ83_010710 [Gryganskiella cystojenkinii]
MPAFVDKFGYTDREDAHDAFRAVLSTTELSLRVRTSLLQKYDVWRRNSGDEYWSSVSAARQVKISTNRTAEHLSQGGENIVGNFVAEQIARGAKCRQLVSADRSEGSFTFQESEYENEDDEDGVDDVNLLPNPQLSDMERPTTNEVISDNAREDSDQSAEDDAQYDTTSEPGQSEPPR